MDRLTTYESIGGHAHAIPLRIDDQPIVTRLADYEDTGLTPAEVRSMHGEWQAMMSVLNSIGGYDRFRELAEADKAGRVVILEEAPVPVIPCNTCDSGWGSYSTSGYDSCYSHCEKLDQYKKALEEAKRHG